MSRCVIGLVLSFVFGYPVRPRLEFFVPILDEEVVVVSTCLDVDPNISFFGCPNKGHIIAVSNLWNGTHHLQATGLGEYLEKDMGSTIWPVCEDFCGTQHLGGLCSKCDDSNLQNDLVSL